MTMTVDKGEVVSVIGGSGSGKSTMLMCINGLEPIQTGSISVDGVEVHSRATDLNKLRRKIGIVFQQFNAFPHLTVMENVMLALRKVLKKSKSEAEAIAVQQLEHVGLRDKLKVYPADFGRTTTEDGNCPGARHVAGIHALRRGDFGARSRAHKRGAGYIAHAFTGGNDDDRRDTQIRFAREVSNRVAFFKSGKILEIGSPDQVIGAPTQPETIAFLRSVL